MDRETENLFPADLRETIDPTTLLDGNKTEPETDAIRCHGDLFDVLDRAAHDSESHKEGKSIVDYQLERIYHAAKSMLVPPEKADLLLHFVQQPGVGIMQAEDRIHFVAAKLPFRFKNKDSALQMIDLIEGFHENKSNPPTIERDA